MHFGQGKGIVYFVQGVLCPAWTGRPSSLLPLPEPVQEPPLQGSVSGVPPSGLPSLRGYCPTQAPAGRVGGVVPPYPHPPPLSALPCPSQTPAVLQAPALWPGLLW